jgi:hypothetical protein
VAERLKHLFNVRDEVRIVKDLSGIEPGVVGLTGRVQELLPASGKHPQYKVLIFGEGKAIGGIFEVDERELTRAS